jgi:hypothetical protein
MMSPRVPPVSEAGNQPVRAAAARIASRKRLMIHLLVPHKFSIQKQHETYASMI